MSGRAASPAVTGVYVETGRRRVFACAVEWPGWARAGRTEEAALAAMAAYAPRYAAVLERAGIDAPGATRLEVVERLEGDAGTDFGVPGAQATCDRRPLTPGDGARLAALVEAAWRAFDAAAAEAPEVLRKGPRGGGRDRDPMVDHVLESESSYLRMVGLRFRPPGREDREAVGAMRAAFCGLLRAGSDGGPVRERGWPARYAARRIAWHALDHAWEMQDRAGP